MELKSPVARLKETIEERQEEAKEYCAEQSQLGESQGTSSEQYDLVPEDCEVMGSEQSMSVPAACGAGYLANTNILYPQPNYQMGIYGGGYISNPHIMYPQLNSYMGNGIAPFPYEQCAVGVNGFVQQPASGPSALALTEEDSSAMKTSFYLGAFEAAKEMQKTKEVKEREEKKLQKKIQEMQIAECFHEEALARRELKRYNVFFIGNRIQLSVDFPGKRTSSFRPLMDEEVTSVQKVISDCPQQTSKMRLKLCVNGEYRIITYSTDEIMQTPETLFTVLRTQGCHIHVPVSSSRDVAIELLNCLDSAAKEVLEPAGTGYYKNRSGNWTLNIPEERGGETFEKRSFSTDEQKLLLILQIASLAFPVLLDWNIRPTRPLTVCAGENFDILLNNLGSDVHEISTAESKKKEIRDAFLRQSKEPFLYFNDFSFRGNSRMDFIVTTMRTGLTNNTRISRLPIVIVEKTPPERVRQAVFLLFFDGNVERNVLVDDMVPRVEDFSLIHEKINELKGEFDKTARFLKSTVCFLYPWFAKRDRLEEYLSLHRYVDKLIELDSQAQDLSDLPEIFIDRLFAYKRINPEVKLVDLAEFRRSDLDETGKTMFHNFQYLYISVELFDSVVSDLDRIADSDRIKQSLEEAGILKTLQTGYTARMSATDENGQLHRPRMLRLDLEKLKKPGELDFLTVYGG